MKRTLFTLWMFLCCTTWCIAVENQSEREHPITQAFNNVAELEFDTPGYLYNVKAQKFFLGANDWDTRASIGDYGWKLKIAKHLNEQGEWDGKTVTITDSVETRQGQWLYVGMFDDKNFWTDLAATEKNILWDIQKQGDYYRISASGQNPDFNTQTDKFVGADLTNGDTRLYTDMTESETSLIEWLFVKEADYMAYQKELSTYLVAQELKGWLDDAKGYGLDVTFQEAVYQNLESTDEEIATAITDTKKAIAAHEEQHVTAQNPVDKTPYILNPDYSEGKTGWDDTNNDWAVSYHVAEHYDDVFDHHQVVKHLPAGLYALTLRGYNRPQNSSTAYEYFTEGKAHNLYMYADSTTMLMPNIWEGASEKALGVGNTSTTTDADGKEWVVTNNMQGAEAYFDHEVYGPRYDATIFFGTDGNSVRIGIKQEQNFGGDWSLWDNWRLTYYGNKADDYNTVLKRIIDENITRFDNVADRMTTGTVENYKTTLNSLTATDAASFHKAQQTIQEAVNTVNANINAWKEYVALVEEGISIVNDVYYWTDWFRILDDYVKETAPAILAKETVTDDELQAEIQWLKEHYKKAIPETAIPNLKNAIWSYAHFGRTQTNETGETEEKISYIRYKVLDKPTHIDRTTYFPLVKFTTCEYKEGEELASYRIRTENNRIYILKEDAPEYFGEFGVLQEEGNDYILYDFNLKTGDEFCKLENGESLNMTATDSVTTIDGATFRTMSVMNNRWIEGIGSTYDFLTPLPFPEVDCDCGSILNYFSVSIHGTEIVYKNPFGDILAVSTAYKEDDCALNPDAIEENIVTKPDVHIHVTGSTILCTSPTAVKLEVYTMDAIKVGEAAFVNGEATVKVGKAPATYLYIVTYPNGRRESGKVAVKD